MAGRSYTQATIKKLFGQARKCAFPGCPTPLIFIDPTRGGETVVAQIAHIRSEVPAGPRHDPTFTGEINGSDNLLLLCGTHHIPVDRHESIYPTAELIVWKTAQCADAGAGIDLSPEDVLRFAGFTAEERAAITAVAKLCSKVERLSVRALEQQAAIREAARWARLLHAEGGWSRTEDGVPTESPASLSALEQRELDAQLDQAWRSSLNRLVVAIDSLAGEVAVLEMMSPVLGPAAREVLSAAEAAAMSREDVGGGGKFAATHTAVRSLWLLVNAD